MFPLILILGLGGLALALLAPKRPAIPGGAQPPKPPPKAPGGGGPSLVGGYDPVRAALLAPEATDDLGKSGRSYNRELLRAFQGAAGIAVDGDYGGATRGALIYYLRQSGSESDPPPPLYPPKETRAYVPPGGTVPGTPVVVPGIGPTTDPLGDMAKLAAMVADDLRAKGKAGYDRDLLKLFQRGARLSVDGQYGPRTRGALIFFGVEDPPAAMYGSGTLDYTPPK